MYSCGPLHMAKQRQGDQLAPTYRSSVRIRGVAQSTYRERWTRGSGISVQMAQQDDDEVDSWPFHMVERLTGLSDKSLFVIYPQGDPFSWTSVSYSKGICHCLPSGRTWHKVKDPKVDYSGGLREGKVGHEPKLKPCWNMMQLAKPKVAQPNLEELRPQVCLCWTVPKQRVRTS